MAKTRNIINLSFEVFPPKNSTAAKKLSRTLQELATHSPKFISVTCGAGGASKNENFAVCSQIMESGGDCVAHVTSIVANKEYIQAKLRRYEEMGINKILALRGDFPPGTDQSSYNGAHEFKYAYDLVKMLRKEFPKFKVYVAGYPEGHNQNPSKEDDFKHQLEKAMLGTEGIITQLFFENSFFVEYAEKLKQSGYKGLIIPGIFPIFDASQVVRLTELCGTSIPKKVRDGIKKFQDDPLSLEQWGAEYAAEQINELKDLGFQEFHIYVMNRSSHISRMLPLLS